MPALTDQPIGAPYIAGSATAERCAQLCERYAEGLRAAPCDYNDVRRATAATLAEAIRAEFQTDTARHGLTQR